MVFVGVFLGGMITGSVFSIFLMAAMWANGGDDAEIDITQESRQNRKRDT